MHVMRKYSTKPRRMCKYFFQRHQSFTRVSQHTRCYWIIDNTFIQPPDAWGTFIARVNWAGGGGGLGIYRGKKKKNKEGKGAELSVHSHCWTKSHGINTNAFRCGSFIYKYKNPAIAGAERRGDTHTKWLYIHIHTYMYLYIREATGNDCERSVQEAAVTTEAVAGCRHPSRFKLARIAAAHE